MLREIGAVIAMCILVGCTSEEEDTAPKENAPEGCGPGNAPNEAAGAGCCPAGTLPLADGSCQPAGIPAELCGVGFEPVGDGCEPVLPPAPCPFGLMAVPGETVCRHVAPCGTPPWGDIPVEPDTEHVDAAYIGGASDGTPARPWTTIGAAIAAAAPGALVAIAAGTYAEDVRVTGKPVRLWGRCPALVEVAGIGTGPAAIYIRNGAGGTEVRDLGVTNASGAGIALTGSEDVLLDRVWVHGTAYRAIDAEDVLGSTSLTVARSLVELSADFGVYVSSSTAVVESSVVRGTRSDSQGLTGRGIDIKAAATSGARANVTVRSCVVEQNQEIGVFVIRSDALIEASVVRGTIPNDQGLLGRGIVVQDHSSGARASATVRSSLVDQNQEIGVFVAGSDVLIEATMVRDTLFDASGSAGRGIELIDDAATGLRTNATVRASVVARNHEFGVLVGGSDGLVESAVVRGTLPNPAGLYGRGIVIQDDLITGARANGTVRGCLVEQNQEIGVTVMGADGLIESTVARAMLANVEGDGGTGIHIEANRMTGARAVATVRFGLIEQCHQTGLSVVTADAVLEGMLVRSTLPNGAGLYGDGVLVFALGGDASARLQSSVVSETARAAVSSFGAYVTLSDVALTCQSLDLAGESFEGRAYQFEDLGNVGCGCPEAAGECRQLSIGIGPPAPLEPPR